jgi:hypothetical protein
MGVFSPFLRRAVFSVAARKILECLRGSEGFAACLAISALGSVVVKKSWDFAVGLALLGAARMSGRGLRLAARLVGGL